MNCTRAEQLIPLHAGGDLQPPEADGLRQHLKACAQCQQLVAEFEASQAWLSEFAAPAFDPKLDEVLFADLRTSVLREIEKTELAGGRGRWFEWLLPKWNTRLAFAAVAVALLLAAGLATFIYRPKSPLREPVVVGGGGKPKNSTNPPPTPHREEQIVGGNNQKHLRPPRVTPSRQQPAPDDPAAGAVEPAATNLTAQNSTDPVATEPATDPSLAQAAPEMLRIEFQTDDPNIRIVWFTPKSPKTEPNTK